MAGEIAQGAAFDAEIFRAKASAVITEVKKVIVGKDDLIGNIFIALLAEGNILLEGVPGVAKTSIVKAFAMALDLDFKRVQFAPDILPSDVTGMYIYSQKDSTFTLRKGPVFTNLFLVDEVNRASPKTQSALLEAMEEKQVSIEGTTFPLPYPYMVITTQNPIDIMGTFPLPEAQIDRFMFKLDVGYPTEEEELEMLRIKNTESLNQIEKVLVLSEVVGMVQDVRQVHVDDKVMQYIRDIIVETRRHEKLLLGGSPRASISFLKASKALAALEGRDYVLCDDVKQLADNVLRHRLILKPEYEMESLTPGDIVKEVVEAVKVPP